MTLAAPVPARLQIDKGAPVIMHGAERLGRYVVVCEHGGRQLPDALGDLGLSALELQSHVAWDLGAAGVASEVARLLDGPLVLQRYSRLVYDCNRPPTSDDAMRCVSEKTVISGNQNLSDAHKLWRTEHIYEPFHAGVGETLNGRDNPILVTVHSFTPVYHGQKRDVDVGILHDQDARFADAMLANNKFDNSISVKRNEPYGPQDGVTHTLLVHSGESGILNVMVEIKSDLIADEVSQKQYAEALAETIIAAEKTL